VSPLEDTVVIPRALLDEIITYLRRRPMDLRAVRLLRKIEGGDP